MMSVNRLRKQKRSTFLILTKQFPSNLETSKRFVSLPRKTKPHLRHQSYVGGMDRPADRLTDGLIEMRARDLKIFSQLFEQVQISSGHEIGFDDIQLPHEIFGDFLSLLFCLSLFHDHFQL